MGDLGLFHSCTQHGVEGILLLIACPPKDAWSISQSRLENNPFWNDPILWKHSKFLGQNMKSLTFSPHGRRGLGLLSVFHWQYFILWNVVSYLYWKDQNWLLFFPGESPKYIVQDVPVVSGSVRVQCVQVHGELVTIEREYSSPNQPCLLLHTTRIH